MYLKNFVTSSWKITSKVLRQTVKLEEYITKYMVFIKATLWIVYKKITSKVLHQTFLLPINKIKRRNDFSIEKTFGHWSLINN